MNRSVKTNNWKHTHTFFVIYSKNQIGIIKEIHKNKHSHGTKAVLHLSFLNLYVFANLFCRVYPTHQKAMRPIAFKPWLWGAFCKITLSVLRLKEASHSLSLSRKNHMTVLDRTAVAPMMALISMGGRDNEHVRSTYKRKNLKLSLKFFRKGEIAWLFSHA